MSAQVESIDTYLKERINDYKNYKKMLSSGRILMIENRGYDYKGWVKQSFVLSTKFI